jgi:hypothetical protein
MAFSLHVPLDGSPLAEAILPTALGLGPTEVVLVHVEEWGGGAARARRPRPDT